MRFVGISYLHEPGIRLGVHHPFMWTGSTCATGSLRGRTVMNDPVITERSTPRESQERNCDIAFEEPPWTWWQIAYRKVAEYD